MGTVTTVHGSGDDERDLAAVGDVAGCERVTGLGCADGTAEADRLIVVGVAVALSSTALSPTRLLRTSSLRHERKIL